MRTLLILFCAALCGCTVVGNSPEERKHRELTEDRLPLSGRDGISQSATGDALVEKVRKRDGTNFLGVYMGMIAEWDGCAKVYDSGSGTMVPSTMPQGVMMFSATSGELLKWISSEDFTNIFILKTKPEYQ